MTFSVPARNATVIPDIKIPEPALSNTQIFSGFQQSDLDKLHEMYKARFEGLLLEMKEKG